jgi:hypothetical protein
MNPPRLKTLRAAGPRDADRLWSAAPTPYEPGSPTMSSMTSGPAIPLWMSRAVTPSCVDRAASFSDRVRHAAARSRLAGSRFFMDARFVFSALAGVFCAVLIIATVTTFRHLSKVEHGRNQPFSAAAARPS